MPRRQSSSQLESENHKMQKLSLPSLPYEYDALEPILSKELMELHHAGHHKTYVENLNEAYKRTEEAEKKGDLETVLALNPLIKFNMGGHVNHSMFWQMLAPKGTGGSCDGELAEAIKQEWGSLDKFKKEFNHVGSVLQGSGWCWLGLHPTTKTLAIVTTQNQDPCIVTGYEPVLGVDAWEHAFYLSYRNKKVQYLEAIWDVINWNFVKEQYSKLMQKREKKIV